MNVNLQEKTEILKARAKLLAYEIKEVKDRQFIEILEFNLSDEVYGLETLYIREVSPLKELTVLPGVPEFVSGITNVRGQILSVMDIKKIFNIPERALTNLNKIIIIHNDEMEFGILADSINGIKVVFVEDIQSSLPTLTDNHSLYLKGITKDNTVVLDAHKLLCDKNIIVNQEI